MLTLQAISLDWALKHALHVGDTDVFPAPFEYLALEMDWESVRLSLLGEDVLRWVTRPPRTLLSPKSKLGFRSITQLDPIDFLIYSSLVYEICDDLEARRIPSVDNTVFSYRIETNSDGQLFSRAIGYRQFLARCREKIDGYPQDCIVATTDISDFYSRIYHHRLENALRSATTKTAHVNSIMGLLSGWNGTETFGIPVGCAASRILAEITLSDVDEALLANGIDFIRYNDDYRIFASSKANAYQHISLLAEVLHTNHGLSLQQHKTTVLPVEEFRARFLSTPLDKEMDSLHDKFSELIDMLGLETGYEDFEYDDLNEEQRELVDALNLSQLLRDEVVKEDPDIPVVRFCLRRLGQLGDASVVDDVFDYLESITAAFVDVIGYFSNLRHLNEESRSELGGRLLDLLDDTIVSELAYHRMWIVHLFTVSTEWDNENRFFNLYNIERDQACKRKLILAMGRANQQHWFQSQWRTLFAHAHWERRAVLAAASCMPGDARKHWYRSVESQLDILELAVMRWARSNPFSR